MFFYLWRNNCTEFTEFPSVTYETKSKSYGVGEFQNAITIRS